MYQTTYIYAIDNSYYIAHHGIKGQRWGVRNFQDATGALTEAGRQRYGRAKKLAKFGVALGKAKAEHYGVQAKKQAKDIARDVEKSAKNLSANVRRAYDPHYYEHRSNQAVLDYRLRKQLTQNHIDIAEIRASEAKKQGKAFLELYQSSLVEEAGISSNIDSTSRSITRNGSQYYDNNISDILSMNMSELRSASGSSTRSISDYGRRYLEAEERKKALDDITWQDYFRAPKRIEYAQSYEARRKMNSSDWSRWYD